MATVKSLSVIVGITSLGSFTEEIFILAPISELSRSIVISFGIFSAGHLSSIVLLTIFSTPPFFNPGDLSLLINFTGISKIIFVPLTTLIKSICIGSFDSG